MGASGGEELPNSSRLVHVLDQLEQRFGNCISEESSNRRLFFGFEGLEVIVRLEPGFGQAERMAERSVDTGLPVGEVVAEVE
ncbi:hypothetical protein KEM48_003930 [Puccinia striiformis f. sp. tritici PST-130]|nr:hypothetical protein KEM48_003930 [Puccinia striiformis f. sp. tritici PST-130]